MKIYTTTDGDLLSFHNMFKDFGEVKSLSKDPRKFPDKIDLLIFTGGEDVMPTLYGESNGKISFNPERDYYERAVYRRAMGSGSPVNKILGICRGIQFLNVMLGGTLAKDIEDYFGKRHDNIHPLNWVMPTIFTEHLQRVNSLHHQCIYGIATRKDYQILATEPSTRTIEAVLWDNRILGFQFHPEYFSRDMEESRNAVASGIIDWVNGRSIFDIKKKNNPASEYPRGTHSTLSTDWS